MIAYLPFAFALAWFAHHVWSGYHNPTPPAPAPADREDPLTVAADYAVSVVALSWGLVWLAVAFAPLALLVWWVAS
jgi:hypothetical protein